jgi:hypothetical protein
VTNFVLLSNKLFVKGDWVSIVGPNLSEVVFKKDTEYGKGGCENYKGLHKVSSRVALELEEGRIIVAVWECVVPR